MESLESAILHPNKPESIMPVTLTLTWLRRTAYVTRTDTRIAPARFFPTRHADFQTTQTANSPNYSHLSKVLSSLPASRIPTSHLATTTMESIASRSEQDDNLPTIQYINAIRFTNVRALFDVINHTDGDFLTVTGIVLYPLLSL